MTDINFEISVICGKVVFGSMELDFRHIPDFVRFDVYNGR
jgi:hypothetical protein